MNNEEQNSRPAADVARHAPPVRQRGVTIRPDAALLAAIDIEVAAQGLPDRAALVSKALTAYLRGHDKNRAFWEREERLQEAQNSRGVDMFTAQQESSGDTRWRYQVSLRETTDRGNPRTYVVIRSYYDEQNVRWKSHLHVHLLRSQLPWLIEALQNAEGVLQERARVNRAAARAGRDPTEAAQERVLRHEYEERYSRTRVDAAVAKAAKHRLRATKYGLTEHFTWWQWLDLCASAEFRCARCRAEAPLEPHHRMALALGLADANRIGNIEPICRACHQQISTPGGVRDVADLWAAEQQEHFARLQVGDVVYHRPQYIRMDQSGRDWVGSRLGVVMEIAPPSVGIGPLWGHYLPERHRARAHYRGVHLISRDEAGALGLLWLSSGDWVVSRARVRWAGGAPDEAGATNEKWADMQDLKSVEIDAVRADTKAWFAQQEEVYQTFCEGAAVRRPYTPKTRHGTIVALSPPERRVLPGIGDDEESGHIWTRGQPARARVQWTSKSGRVSHQDEDLDQLILVAG